MDNGETMKKTKKQQGSIIVTILILMMFFSTLVLGLLVVTQANLTRARGRILLLQAQYAAESGADAAIATLNSGNTGYTGADSEVSVLNNGQYRATFTTSVSAGSNSNEKIITAQGNVYSPASATAARYIRKIRVIAKLSSTSTATSMLSRNIIEVGSGVKNIVSKDVYVNGYIQMDKNTTNLVAENITVAGRAVGANNCSIGGSGNLVKPSSFSTPGQTTTNITLAYNNCINPPGNTSNSDFTVLANQNSISPLQSTYIPWSQYMDSSYTNAGSCSDWTTGASTVNIPSTAGSKKTQYPDSSSNISASCGTNGDLSLGSATYNLSDSIHIRANLCAASACNPTFNNTTANPVYVFVEGTINFGSLNTSAGSGPIVFITYGSDPASQTSVCPLGGSIYLGNAGTTYAPKAYLLAMNGICLDKTKFGNSSLPSTQANGLPTPALGGLGGKNIYVSTNPGSPWDLALDPSFPVNQIPINLSWREASYERL